MTKTMNHSNCDHPATKAARAACRKARRAQEASQIDAREEIRAAYFAGVDIDMLLGMIAMAGIDVDEDADIEEIIASL